MGTSTTTPADFGICTQLFGDERTRKTQLAPRKYNLRTRPIIPIRKPNHSDVTIASRPKQWGNEVADAGQFLYGRTSFWPNGQTLSVKFLDGTEAQKTMVTENAVEWSNSANIAFEFSDYEDGDQSHIRVSFVGPGNQSNVGTYLHDLDGADATMVLGEVEDDSLPLVARAVILHEFGYALGLLHEHQSPTRPFEWDVDAVKAYYVHVLDWTELMVDTNILHTNDPLLVDSTVFDSASIMAYRIPSSFREDGGAEIPWNTELSGVDKATIKLMYPPPPPVILLAI